MEKIRNDFYNETIYKEVLDNGLTVYLMPKKGFSQYSAIFMTNYGSFDNEFIPLGERDLVKMPEGIAHFLEHKMFEMTDGSDVNDIFSNMGVEANAYTSYDRTAYTIFGTDNSLEAVELLIDFVQSPSFTDESVDKEKSIIEQELLMYLDNEKTASKIRFLKTLYGEANPIAKDIGGTVESIRQINKETLLKCYNTFYNPGNMTLVVVGGIEVESLLKMIKENQSKKTFMKYQTIQKKKQEYFENADVIYETSNFNISTPIVTVGFKFPYDNENVVDSSKKSFALDYLFDAYFSGYSSFTEKLRKNGLGEINPIYSATYYSGYGFFTISTTTNKYEKFIKLVEVTIEEMLNEEFKEEKLKTLKRGIHTNFIKRFNNVQGLCNDLAELHFKGVEFFESVDLPTKVTLEDIANAKNKIANKKLCIHVVLPNEK